MFHVVDDNPVSGKNIVKIVNLFDEEAKFFTSAIAYLDYVKSDEYETPDAIFTDLFMYKMDGYELIEEVLAIHPEQKFVVVSGRPDLNHPNKYRACFYLTKPFYIRDIEKIIQEVRACAKDGPSAESDCAHRFKCPEFGLGEWKCPHA